MTKTHSITTECTRDTKILVSRDGFMWTPRYLSRIFIDSNDSITVIDYVGGRDSYTVQEILNPNAREEICEYAELYSYFYKE